MATTVILFFCVVSSLLRAAPPPEQPRLVFLQEEDLYCIVPFQSKDDSHYQLVRRRYTESGFSKAKEYVYEFIDTPFYHSFYRWRIAQGAFWGSDARAIRPCYREVSFDELDYFCAVRTGKRDPDYHAGSIGFMIGWELVPITNAFTQLKVDTRIPEGVDPDYFITRLIEYDMISTGKNSVLGFKLVGKTMDVFQGDLKCAEPMVQEGDWTLLDSFRVGFQEPFQAYRKGNAYYFVTSSGHVHASFKPKEGKRSAERVQTEGGQSITTVVTEVKSETTFAFSAPVRRDDKPAKGSLLRFDAEKVVVQPYSAQVIKPVKEDSAPVKQAIEYTQFLIDGRFIRLK